MINPRILAAFAEEVAAISGPAPATKEAANRLSAGLKIPGLANAGKPPGLTNPTRAGGQNLAKFQLAGPGKTPMTGKSQSVVASQSLANAGQTGSLSLPAPMTPRGPQ